MSDMLFPSKISFIHSLCTCKHSFLKFNCWKQDISSFTEKSICSVQHVHWRFHVSISHLCKVHILLQLASWLYCSVKKILLVCKHIKLRFKVRAEKLSSLSRWIWKQPCCVKLCTHCASFFKVKLKHTNDVKISKTPFWVEGDFKNVCFLRILVVTKFRAWIRSAS